jgi:hypothetical protein
MSMKNVILGTLVLALLGRGAFAQDPTGPSGPPPGPAPAGPADNGGAPPPMMGSFHAPIALSPWIQGTCDDCCGPLSDANPLRTELFLRLGWTIPFGSGSLVDSIDPGFAVQGGGRSLLFNRLGDAAWTFELGGGTYNNPSDGSPVNVPLLNTSFTVFDQNGQQLGRVAEPLATANVRSLNRTFVNLGAGREWYLLGGAAGTRDNPNPGMWRAGFDGGGRYGTAKVQLSEYTAVGETLTVAPSRSHLTDTIAAVYLALHSDIDIPCGCCIFQAGFRAEWDYTWSDILQVQNKSDVMSANLLFNMGVRY